ncbi:hypothetical protein ACT7DD_31440 [Bacillus paranthracis]
MKKTDEVEEAKRLEKLRGNGRIRRGFSGSVYTVPSSPNESRIKLKEMYQFCREKGIGPEDLTEEELEHFLFP